MALKFLNKKGWHTGSLRNIENVWKAEQKHEAEEKKLEELKKQIQEERERSEFRQLQEQAGLVPRQERLDFLYESGLAVGKSSESFKELAAPPTGPAPVVVAEPSSSKAAVPGALFEDKPQSANDSWRKLHSDPLLLIRQREKEALDRIKNNPMKMALIKKSVEVEKKHKGHTKREKKERKGKHKLKHEKHSSKVGSDSEASEDVKDKRKREVSPSDRRRSKRKFSPDVHSESDDSEYEEKRRRHSKHLSQEERRNNYQSNYDEHREEDERKNGLSKYDERHAEERRNGGHSRHEERQEEDRRKDEHSRHGERQEEDRRKDDRSRHGDRRDGDGRKGDHSNYEQHGEGRKVGRSQYNERREDERYAYESTTKPEGGSLGNGTGPGYSYNRRRGVPKMSEEERAARLREMQLDAELHEEQRWTRLKKAAEADALEAKRARSSSGKNFLDDAQKSFFGTERGGSATIEESLRRRTFYSQGGSAAHESNAFRR